MTRITDLITRIRQEKFPIRFIVSRILLRLNIDLPVVLIFWPPRNIKTYLHASSAAHKLFIGKYKPALDIAVFEKFIKAGDVVMDVGANIGMYALLAGKITGSEGRVFAFEPTKKTFNCLVDNISLNQATNVTPVNAVVSDKDGALSFFEHEYSHEQNYIAGAGEKGREVKSVRMDTFMKEARLQSASFVKIDVEGAEMLVLESFSNLLEAVDTLYLEFNSDNYTRFGYTKDQMFNYLQGKGFEMFEPSLTNNHLELKLVTSAEGVAAGNIVCQRKNQ